jgi:hypothetical protein
MFEEIRMAYQIAKKLKSVKWEVYCHETYGGEIKAFTAFSPEYGRLWVATGYEYFGLDNKHLNEHKGSQLYDLDKLSNISRWIIWNFGGFSDIYWKHYVSAETNSKRKLKEMQEKLIKHT